MNKRGITLIELIAVIAIIALLVVGITPQVTKLLSSQKKATLEIQKNSIKEAATEYVADNVGINIFLTDTGEEVVTLQQLIDGGYISGKMENSETKKEFNPEETKVIITKEENGIYAYKVEIKDK